MKKLMAVLAAVAGFLSIYAVVAWFQIRGLRVYTIHSSLGAAFANSWLICAVAAGVLWLLVILLACAGRGRKTKRAGAQNQGKAEKKGGKSKGKEPLIEPKRPGAAQNPAQPVSPGFSEMPQAQQPLFPEGTDSQTEFMEKPKNGGVFPGGHDDGQTEFMDEPKGGGMFSGSHDDGQTEFMDEPRGGSMFSGSNDNGRTEFMEEPKGGGMFSGSHNDGQTEFMDEPKSKAGSSGSRQDRTEFADDLRMPDELDMSNSWMGGQVKEEADGPLYCGHCGAQLTKGQKFCMKCGTKVGSV